jgi:hypothetical protein
MIKHYIKNQQHQPLKSVGSATEDQSVYLEVFQNRILTAQQLCARN